MTIAQTGSHARWLGRIDVDGDEITASLLEVTEDVPLHPRVLEAMEAAERDLDASLDEVIAELEEPLDAQWVAEMLRRRMDAEVGLATSAVVLDRPLAPGPLRRGELWEACHSTANPALTELTGAQLAHMLERGGDPEFQQTTTNALRGRPRGRLHAAGLEEVDPACSYRVAATDFELEPYGELVPAGWRLRIRYDFPTIIREAIEEQLTAGS